MPSGLHEELGRKLDSLPITPGVYVFLGSRGETLYVGKARNLRSRVRSYFLDGSSDTRFFIARLPKEAHDLETFVVGTEKEAALLENEIIKARKPKYNFKLRDDKQYLSIRLDLRENWPRLVAVRKPKQDGASYFGPYDSATAARKTLRLVNRHFQLRTCRDSEFKARTRPCLQHQIKRCLGPCVLDVKRDDYLAQARMVQLFLAGKHEELQVDLQTKMQAAASELRFEQAALHRDQLRAVSRVQESQRIASSSGLDQDVLGLYAEGDRVEIALMAVRGGRLRNVRTFDVVTGLPDDELVASFLREYYETVGGEVPDEVLVPCKLEAQEGLEEWLSEERGKKLRILVPQRGGKSDLLKLAEENAAHAFREKAREREDIDERLQKTQSLLRLPAVPMRIECFDISHLGGQDTVAAMTVSCRGELQRKLYRGFHVQSVSGGDDFGAMREVLSRRFARLGQAGWEAPDLLVVDGGKGQLAVAVAVLAEMNLTHIPVCGLAKEKEKADGRKNDERIFLVGQKNPIVLQERHPARHFLTSVRDEAHRFSNELRKKLGKRNRLRSALENIPGLGPNTTKKLLRGLGSFKQVALASEAELSLHGASKTQAARIFDVLANYRDELVRELPLAEPEVDVQIPETSKEEVMVEEFELETVEYETGETPESELAIDEWESADEGSSAS